VRYPHPPAGLSPSRAEGPNVPPGCYVRVHRTHRHGREITGPGRTYLDLNQSRAERAKAEEKGERESQRAPRALTCVYVCLVTSEGDTHRHDRRYLRP